MAQFIIERLGSVLEIFIVLATLVFGIGYLIKKTLATGDKRRNENNDH